MDPQHWLQLIRPVPGLLTIGLGARPLQIRKFFFAELNADSTHLGLDSGLFSAVPVTDSNSTPYLRPAQIPSFSLSTPRGDGGDTGTGTGYPT